MLKKFFSAFSVAVIIFFAANSQALAAKNVAVILEMPTGTFSEPEKVQATVLASLEKILGNLNDYNIAPVEDVASYVQVYREENDLVETVTAEGTAVEAFLKKADVDKIGKHFNSDYVIYLRVSSTVPKVSVGVFSTSQTVNAILDFRVWSDVVQDFTYIKRTTKSGTSSAIYAGIGSSARALDKALKKCLHEVEKDAEKVRAVIE